ncbi:peroxidase 5-like [Dendrobium catenatum]|uniref:peroxidase 5-like n=1 Tax=Dendrobium catenatum TaxID=906689 RepID=UPI00109F7269|nr:peroxidase 5-like [Dendrobium catenatum]
MKNCPIYAIVITVKLYIRGDKGSLSSTNPKDIALQFRPSLNWEELKMALRGVLLLLFGVLLCVNVDGLQAVQVVGNGTLQLGYYRTTCPQAESIVKEEVAKALSTNYGLAAGLVRMHFHDCFVRGCDGSVLIDSTSNNVAEKDAPPNNPSLRGFEVIDSAKARLESLCSKVVSCADILAFAARDSVQFSGGLPYQVPAGRKDGRISQATETISLPPPTSNLSQLTQMFANKGLNQGEMVTLSGAHTIGRSHCSSFSKRLYNFNTTVSQDPSLDPAYATQLKQQCPNSSVSANLTVPMDPRTPNLLDTSYYSGILANRGLFTSDQTLLSNASTAALVQQNARNWWLFQSKFAAAIIKMGQIDVLTGSQGEIRANCRRIN